MPKHMTHQRSSTIALYMQPSRIAELLEPFLEETAGQVKLYEDISTYIDILIRWNARINLTAIRDPEEIVTRHFGESLFVARHLFPGVSSVSTMRSAVKPLTRVADLGSGAGFPGIPLKLWAREISLTLIESNHKKVAFLREIVRSLTLTDINIQNLRAEALAPEPGFDVVTVRAVERFSDVLSTAVKLIGSSGRLALLIGSAQLAGIRAVGLSWQAPVPIPLSRSRVLLVGHREPRKLTGGKVMLDEDRNT
jgi:16S rRNA (guanine527-N7)-methyltransferase